MPHDPRKSLEDIRRAASLIAKFSDGKSFENYQSDDLLHAAVERELMIIGEAMTRLTKVAPHWADQLPERRQVIAFRNILVHGYDIVDDTVVWDIIQNHLPLLTSRAEAMLRLDTKTKSENAAPTTAPTPSASPSTPPPRQSNTPPETSTGLSSSDEIGDTSCADA